MAVKKEACLLSQTDAASMLHRREGDRRRNIPCSPQDLFLDREAERTPKPHSRPSDSAPSLRLVQDCSVKRGPVNSAVLRSQGSLETSGSDAERLAWNSFSEHQPDFEAPEPNTELSMNNALNFAAQVVSKELGQEDSTSNFPSVCGEEFEDRVPPLPPERHPNKSNSESCRAELHSLATIPADKPCMANQEKSAITVTNSPYSGTLLPSANAAKVIDSLQVNTQATSKNLGDLLFVNIDSACFPSARLANAFEINNNAGKVFSPSQSTAGVLPVDSRHPNKCHSSIADIFSDYDSVVSAGCAGEGGCTPVALQGPAAGSAFGTSRNAAKTLALESDFCVSPELLKNTAVSSQREVGRRPGTPGAGGDPSLPVLAGEETRFRKAHKESFQTECSPVTATGESATDSETPCNALAAEATADNTLERSSVVLDALCSNFSFKASISPFSCLEDVHVNVNVNADDGLQRILKEEGGDSLKGSNRALLNNLTSGSDLAASHSEANDPSSLTSPHKDALNHHILAESKTTGKITETDSPCHSPKSNCSNITELPKAEEKDSASMNPLCSTIDSSFVELSLLEASLQQGGCHKQEESEPPPKPPRIFNESTAADQQVNDRPEEGQEGAFQRQEGFGYPGVLECSEDTRAISFEDLHAKVAPGLRRRSSADPTAPGPPLHGSAPRASSAPPPETNPPSTLFPSLIPTPLSVRPPAGTAQAAAPSSTAPPVIGSAHRVLPEETRPADSSLSHHVSSPHPVKPLTAATSQGEKKPEGRSVLVSGLEKLKSTIHPGRAAQPGEPEAERNKAEGAARYDHLTNNEIIALLLQREAELKKMRVQVRDLEDYIDRLLVRIMEQKPTLLQVRSRYK
ncbi:hypothetical protein MATL_G00193050 [Megalops atlanticus]|uniref:FIP-RBD domain-containing protein n=1 Tax=Megalops atlanticus TaxID=7932 RepID=A0A9D3PJ60_MEGAT|nr:hypothetical protein MATL_G00193050 [Megalops atlanticus]